MHTDAAPAKKFILLRGIDAIGLGKALQNVTVPAESASVPRGSEFTDTLSQPECKDLLNSLDGFIKSFPKNKHSTVEEGTLVLEFLNTTQAVMKDHPVFKTMQVGENYLINLRILATRI